jgi:CRP/FNR family transcriptional regulator, cyclic AMP receptor protein
MGEPGFLQEVRLFENLEAEHRLRIEEKCKLHQVDRGNLVIRKGDENCDVFFVISGQVAVFSYIDAQNQVFLTEFFAGDMFGELAVIDGGTRSAWVVAASDVTLATLGGDDFMTAVTTHDVVALNTLKHFAGVIRGSSSRIRSLVLQSSRQRVCTELIRMAGVTAKATGEGAISDMPSHEALAAFSGADPEAVSRVIGDLMREGIIARKMRTMRILDVARLKLFAHEEDYQNMDSEEGVQSLFNEIYSADGG